MEKIIADYFADYTQVFRDAFLQMKQAYELGDIDGFIDGTNQITKKLGGNVPFETFKEFEEIMDSSEPLKI